PEDLAIPEWRVVQKVGGDWAKQQGAQPGNFYNSSDDEIASELNIVVVDILSGRARWGEEISDAGPVCASLDAKNNISMNKDDCSQCSYRLDAPWTADAGERRKMCCLNYTILGITFNNYMPCLIRAHGISALPIRQLLTQLKLNKALRGEYYRAIVNIKTQEKTTKYGSAFALHPRIVELITDEAKAKELKAESNRLLGAPIPLPEGRPEDEPIAFTPEGQPVYTEEEKQRVLAQAATLPPTPATSTTPSPATITVAKEPVPDKEEKKESNKKELDLDF
ncbi:MAG: hypothetical protein V1932_02090, partial [Chloroflexota bacterium]